MLLREYMNIHLPIIVLATPLLVYVELISYSAWFNNDTETKYHHHDLGLALFK